MFLFCSCSEKHFCCYFLGFVLVLFVSTYKYTASVRSSWVLWWSWSGAGERELKALRTLRSPKASWPHPWGRMDLLQPPSTLGGSGLHLGPCWGARGSTCTGLEG